MSQQRHTRPHKHKRKGGLDHARNADKMLRCPRGTGSARRVTSVKPHGHTLESMCKQRCPQRRIRPTQKNPSPIRGNLRFKLFQMWTVPRDAHDHAGLVWPSGLQASVPRTHLSWRRPSGTKPSPSALPSRWRMTRTRAAPTIAAPVLGATRTRGRRWNNHGLSQPHHCA